MGSPTFESLHIWHDARDVVSRVYSMTRTSGFASDFALRDQIRRAALSNIAEGHERSGNREFVHFLSIAKSSCGEVRSQLYVAEDVGYIGSNDAAELRGAAANLSRKIQALAASRKGKGEPLCGKRART
jgi:four helix bundle protein